MEKLLSYIDCHSKYPFDYSSHIEKFKHPQQHMICEKVVGNFLSIMVQIKAPKNILEIGTMIGFSTICMAKKMLPDSSLETIEIREEDAHHAQENFSFFGVQDKIKLHIGNALEIIPKINKPWDFVFIDADKTNYLNYYNLVFPFVKKNGIIIFDNMLFYQQVIDENIHQKNVETIRQTNSFLSKDKRVNNVLLNVRDGIQLVIKN